MENTNANGAYDLEGVIYHQHSNKLMKELLQLWPDKNIPIVDIGCGHNFYVSVFNYAGYDAMGVDSVDLGHKAFKKLDLTENDIVVFGGGRQHVLSLEVGEHIPSEFSKRYLDTITSQGGGDILLSWAVPGQAGHGHINCQSNAWVMEQMKKRGYEMDFQVTHDLRQAVVGCHCRWFLNTLMYFKPTVDVLG